MNKTMTTFLTCLYFILILSGVGSCIWAIFNCPNFIFYVILAFVSIATVYCVGAIAYLLAEYTTMRLKLRKKLEK
jgi:hypothetical protein